MEEKERENMEGIMKIDHYWNNEHKYYAVFHGSDASAPSFCIGHKAPKMFALLK